MRDIALTVFILGALPFVLKRPQLGVLLYVWISVMNPHRLTWGFAYEWPFAQIVGAATLVGVALSRQAKWPQLNSLLAALVLFVAWTGVTTAAALYPAESYVRWTALLKTQVMVLLIPVLFHRKEDLRLLLWVIALSIAFFGAKGGIATIVTGGETRVYGPTNSYIEDNTSLGVGIIMIIPLLYYLLLTTTRKLARWTLVGMMLLCAVGVLGTYSRGALLAVCTMGIFLWWKGQHKLAILLVLLLVAPLGLALMPEKWHARMDTIRTYEADISANMRLNSWMTMFNLAKDRPLTGAGFEAGTKEVYDRYAPDPTRPPQTAHSIYFQVLGEHGFVGLALYIWMLVAAWRKCGGMMRVAKNRAELAWAGELGRMMQVTLVGFAVGGAFLSLVNFDVPYYLVGVILCATALARREADVPPAPQRAIAHAGPSPVRS